MGGGTNGNAPFPDLTALSDPRFMLERSCRGGLDASGSTVRLLRSFSSSSSSATAIAGIPPSVSNSSTRGPAPEPGPGPEPDREPAHSPAPSRARKALSYAAASCLDRAAACVSIEPGFPLASPVPLGGSFHVKLCVPPPPPALSGGRFGDRVSLRPYGVPSRGMVRERGGGEGQQYIYKYIYISIFYKRVLICEEDSIFTVVSPGAATARLRPPCGPLVPSSSSPSRPYRDPSRLCPCQSPKRDPSTSPTSATARPSGPAA